MAAIGAMQKGAATAKELASLAFLLAAAAGMTVFWSRSYTNADFITFYTPAGKVQSVASVDGSFVICFTSISFGPERGLSLRCETADPEVAHDIGAFGSDTSRTMSRFGFGWAVGKFDGFDDVTDAMSGSWTALWCPDWGPLLLAILAVSVKVRWRWIHYRRCKNNLCVNCGYDLRFSADRCPECGEMPTSPAAQISD